MWPREGAHGSPSPRSRRYGTAIVVVLLALSATTVGSRDLAEAIPEGTVLPFDAFADIVVDEAHEHVFVTGGRGNDGVAVLDLDGNLIETIDGPHDASGLVLDGSSLYVGRASYKDASSSSIYEIDTGTLSLERTIAIATRTSGDLGFAGGKIWFSAEACQAWGHLVALDPSTGDVAWTSGSNATDLDCPIFSSAPAALPDELIIGGNRYFNYDVSSIPPTLIASDFGKSVPNEYVLSPDGSSIFATGIREYSTSDFTETGRTFGTSSVAAAVTAEGGRLLLAWTERLNHFYFDLYSLDDAALLASFDMGEPPAWPRRAVFDATASVIFAVSRVDEGSVALFLLDPSQRNVDLALTADPAMVSYGDATTVTAQLETPPDMIDRTVRIYATRWDSDTRILIADAEVGGDGRLSVPFQPEIGTSFLAEYAGDVLYTSQFASTEVLVRVLVTGRLHAYYGVEGRYHLYRLDHRLRASAEVTPHLDGSVAYLTIERRRPDGGWKPFETATRWTDASGTSEFTVWMRRIGRYRVRVTGTHEGYLASSTAWMFVRVTA